MEITDIPVSAETNEEWSLSKLVPWLTYEKYTATLGFVGVWISYSLVLNGLGILAIIFTPYMIWHLLKAGWYKSVLIFTVFVIVPFIITRIVNTDTMTFAFLLKYAPLLAFYIYTWILSYVIGEYLSEIKTSRRWEMERKLKESLK